MDHRELKTFDLNGDGHLDLIIASRAMDHSLNYHGNLIMFGNGDGTFGPALELEKSSSTTTTLFDIDGDQTQDVIFGDLSSPTTWFRNLGDGSFEGPNFLDLRRYEIDPKYDRRNDPEYTPYTLYINQGGIIKFIDWDADGRYEIIDNGDPAAFFRPK